MAEGWGDRVGISTYGQLPRMGESEEQLLRADLTIQGPILGGHSCSPMGLPGKPHPPPSPRYVRASFSHTNADSHNTELAGASGWQAFHQRVPWLIPEVHSSLGVARPLYL